MLYNVTPPLSRVKQAGKKALGSSHAQFIATVGFEATQRKLLPLVVHKKRTQQRLHPELIPSWRPKIDPYLKPTTSKPASQWWSSTETSFLHAPTRIPKSSCIHPALCKPRLKNTSLYEEQLDMFSEQQLIFLFPVSREGYAARIKIL